MERGRPYYQVCRDEGCEKSGHLENGAESQPFVEEVDSSGSSDLTLTSAFTELQPKERMPGEPVATEGTDTVSVV